MARLAVLLKLGALRELRICEKKDVRTRDCHVLSRGSRDSNLRMHVAKMIFC